MLIQSVIFSEGPTPYLFINTPKKIHAVQLLTKERGIVASGLQFSALAVDVVEMKLYFQNNNGIRARDFNGVDVSVIIENTNVEKMAVDWIGRHIFWTEHSSKWIRRKYVVHSGIFVANLDEKKKRKVTSTKEKPNGIAVDPISG